MASKSGKPSHEPLCGTGETQAPVTLIKSVKEKGLGSGNAVIQAQLTLTLGRNPERAQNALIRYRSRTPKARGIQARDT